MTNETESYFTLEDQLESMSLEHSYIDANDRMVIVNLDAISLTRFFWSVLVSKYGQIQLSTGFSDSQEKARGAIAARLDEIHAGDPTFTDWTFITTRPGETRYIR